MALTNCKSEKMTPKILELASKNLTTKEICNKLKLSKNIVNKVIMFNNGLIKKYKPIGCKSKRLEPQILDLLNRGYFSSYIANKLSLSTTTIKKVAKRNGIDFDERILKQKKERNENIYNLLLEGKKYGEIAEEMGVTKQRVYEVAKTYNYKRWDESKKKYQDIISELNQKIESGVNYETIKSKYLNNKKLYYRLLYHGLETGLYKQYTKKRNKEIGSNYQSGKKAAEIIKSKDKILKDPKKITDISSIYSICSKQGIYKYPKVGRRIDGGSFEDFTILRLIKHLRETKKMSFDDIAIYLNSKGYKTVCGKRFNMANARFKYKDALKEGL